jgi:NADPH:quinone reductase-like Zn-dependent oxidoreductase
MIATISAARMRAIVCARPGPAGRLQVSEVEPPVVPDDGVLVRVHASSANPVDLFPTSIAGYIMGGRKPQVLGTDFAGTVEEVGKSVTSFKPGDEVFGGARGAFAELLAAPESVTVRKPAEVSFEAAGTVAVAATTALQALRTHGGLQAGQHVLINGASGGVGTFAVQLARALGAEVTAVCGGHNVEMVRALGADTVIDYAADDFTLGSTRYDLVVDIAGSHSLGACRRVLKPEGTFVGVGAAAVQHGSTGTMRALGHFLGVRIASVAARQKVVTLFIANLNRDDLAFLGELLESGKIVPEIGRRYDLDGVPEALQHISDGHVKAKVAIRVR